MRLRAKQSLFVHCLADLLTYAHLGGWEFTLGEAHVINPRKIWDEARVGEPIRVVRLTDAEHMNGSLHYQRLAIDLNLFVDGKYIRSGRHPAYVQLGTYWESLHPLCRWGGRFNDANHFSLTHAGKA